ncbi:unnamed protein product [Effrenium voratum]|uniref:BTB domain-containing protein n=1 Tax=Effrenium voratum TaxID=2562239 RepID=A0AA36JKN0_9DINO|nr:unnamed protein product [Effrenium voratum]CAJ1407965.1 unnamed protein product [Effrenium voratum]
MAMEAEPKRPRKGPDLKIVVDDGELEVHSVILELASPVFASMLSSAMKEGSGDSIKLPGKYKSELEAFYKALQLCTMEAMTPANAIVLSKWADEYQVEALKQKCDQFLVNQPVDGAALQHAVKYSLEKRRVNCIATMKTNIPKYVDDLQVLTSRECQEDLKELWPAIARAANLPAEIALPPAEHQKSAWPFLATAVKLQLTASELRVKANQLQLLESDLKTWPDRIFHHMPASNQADRKAKNWIISNLAVYGILAA